MDPIKLTPHEGIDITFDESSGDGDFSATVRRTELHAESLWDIRRKITKQLGQPRRRKALNHPVAVLLTNYAAALVVRAKIRNHRKDGKGLSLALQDLADVPALRESSIEVSDKGVFTRDLYNLTLYPDTEDVRAQLQRQADIIEKGNKIIAPAKRKLQELKEELGVRVEGTSYCPDNKELNTVEAKLIKKLNEKADELEGKE